MSQDDTPKRGLLTQLRKWLTPTSTPPPPLTPLTSPVPWVSDGVWTAWYGRVPAGSVDEDELSDAIEQAQVVVATMSDRSRVPRVPVPTGAPVPPTGGLAEQVQRLAQTQGPGFGTLHPIWPVCCERLATLVLTEGVEAGPLTVRALEALAGQTLDAAWLEGEEGTSAETYGPALKTLRESETGHDGINVFQWRHCGRIYLGSCHP